MQKHCEKTCAACESFTCMFVIDDDDDDDDDDDGDSGSFVVSMCSVE